MKEAVYYLDECTKQAFCPFCDDGRLLHIGGSTAYVRNFDCECGAKIRGEMVRRDNELTPITETVEEKSYFYKTGNKELVKYTCIKKDAL